MTNTLAEIFNQIFILLILAIPIAAAIWFAVSLILYLRTPKDAPDRQARRRRLIVASVLFGCIDGLALVLFILLMIGLAHM